MKNYCLNCEKELAGNYCAGCGQKADTHRISFKNFIFHDILHGTFHLDKGILHTAKQALIQPGKAALEYIAGKRKRYYNVFYLILITVGLMMFFRHYYEVLDIAQGREFNENPVPLNEASTTIDNIISQKSKIIIFLFVPFSALNSFLLFRRKKLNLSEHSIISGMILLGILLFSLFGNLLWYVDLLVPFSDQFADSFGIAITAIILIYIAYGYANAFNAEYTKWSITYRVFLFFALLFLEMMILLYLLVGFATQWKFGAVTITPFS